MDLISIFTLSQPVVAFVATGTALAIAAVAIAAAGAGVGAYSAVEAGKAAEDTAKYNAKVAENSAQAAADQAAAEAEQVRRANRLRAGAQRAGYGKAGVDLSGSAEDVFFDTGAQGELEALSTLYGGSISSGYYQSRAVGSRFEGQQARRAGNIQAGATLLSGLASTTSLASRLNEPSFANSASNRATARGSGQYGIGRG